MSKGAYRDELGNCNGTNVFFSQIATSERMERTRTSDHREKEAPETQFFN